MSKKTDKNLPAKIMADYENFAVVSMDMSDFQEIVQSNMGGETIRFKDFERIKVPSGGNTTWTTLDKDGNEIDTKEIEGILIYGQNIRQYFKDDFNDTGGGVPPDCMSMDCITGIGTPGGLCKQCEYSQWESARKGKGQACSERRLVFIMTENSGLLPNMISIPPKSLDNARSYQVACTFKKNRKMHTLLTGLTLEKDKNDNGIEYSKVVFKTKENLPEEMVEKINAYSEGILPVLEQKVRAEASKPSTDNDTGPAPGAVNTKASDSEPVTETETVGSIDDEEVTEIGANGFSY